jgi:hypothetical protein
VFSTIAAVDRILKAELSATCAGTDHRRGRTRPARPTGRSRSASAASPPSSVKARARRPAAVNYYAKTFWKNTNGTNALLGATVSESADPSGTITHGLATAVNDSGTTTNRQTAPGGVVFDGTAKATVPGHRPRVRRGDRQRLWLNMTLATNNVPIRSTYTSQLAGSTT